MMKINHNSIDLDSNDSIAGTLRIPPVTLLDRLKANIKLVFISLGIIAAIIVILSISLSLSSKKDKPVPVNENSNTPQISSSDKFKDYEILNTYTVDNRYFY